MSFSRREPVLLEREALDAAMRGIGMRVGVGARRDVSPDIEVTLVSASQAASPTDFRLFGVLAAWLEQHHARVNVPRLKRAVMRASLPDVARAWWSAVGTWLGRQDRRWCALEATYTGRRIDLDDPEITALQMKRVGADPRFAETKLAVHAKLLRSRATDVDSPAQLAARNSLYRRRIEFGPSYRADVFHALESDPQATPAQIARRVGCAYETARSVAEDFRLMKSIAV